ncbi:uncharacterized protein LOC122263435 [Penaeus japonicus]|uniref:uncharacterized protein LOC122263435 n=1 Tax=Penaeus japonicus TaxID=27405 RepID=UPI001C714B17|nr:uncharacterized protein LOC122263435 [Penaeus japonicus]
MSAIPFIASLYIIVGGFGFFLSAIAMILIATQSRQPTMSLTVYGLTDTIAGVLTGVGVFCDGCLQFTHLIYSNSCHRYYVVYALMVFPLAAVNFSALGMGIERFQVVRNSVSQSSKFHRLFPFTWTMTTCLSALTLMIVLWGNTHVHSIHAIKDHSFYWEKSQDIRHTRGLLDDLWAYNSQHDSFADQQEEIVISLVRSIIQNFSSTVPDNVRDDQLNDQLNDFNLPLITQLQEVHSENDPNLSTALQDIAKLPQGHHNVLSKFPVRRFSTTVLPLNNNKVLLAKATATPSPPALPLLSNMTIVAECNTTQRKITNTSHHNPNLAKTFLPSIADIIHLLTGPSHSVHPNDVKDQETADENLTQDQETADENITQDQETADENITQDQETAVENLTQDQETADENLTQDQETEENQEHSAPLAISTQSLTETQMTDEPVAETVYPPFSLSEIPPVISLVDFETVTLINPEFDIETSLDDTDNSTFTVATLDDKLISNTQEDSVTHEYIDTSEVLPEVTTTHANYESFEVEIEANVESSVTATSHEKVSEEIEVTISTLDATTAEESSTPPLCPVNAFTDQLASDPPINTPTPTPLSGNITINFKTASQTPEVENISSSAESDENISEDFPEPNRPTLYTLCYTKERFLQTYTTIIFTCIFAAPLLVTTGLNAYVAWSLTSYRHSRLTETTNNNWLKLRKAVLRALILLAANAICWMPFMVERLLYVWVSDWDLPSAVPALLFLLGHSHNVLRGIFYLLQYNQVHTRVSPEPIRPASLPGVETSPGVPMQVTMLPPLEGDHPFLIPHARDKDPSPRTARLVPREPVASSPNPSSNSPKPRLLNH